MHGSETFWACQAESAAAQLSAGAVVSSAVVASGEPGAASTFPAWSYASV